MTPEQVLKIDKASMDILEEIGVVFRDPIALEDWKRAGATVSGERVHHDRNMVRELITSIPSDITLHARDPKKSVDLGGPNAIFIRNDYEIDKLVAINIIDREFKCHRWLHFASRPTRNVFLYSLHITDTNDFKSLAFIESEQNDSATGMISKC